MIISRISISNIILDLINRQVDALSLSLSPLTLSLSFSNKDLVARDLSLESSTLGREEKSVSGVCMSNI